MVQYSYHACCCIFPPHPPTSSHLPPLTSLFTRHPLSSIFSLPSLISPLTCHPVPLAVPSVTIMNAYVEVVDVESGKDFRHDNQGQLQEALCHHRGRCPSRSLVRPRYQRGFKFFIDGNPIQSITGGRPSKICSFRGSLAEVDFSLLRLFFGLSAILLRAHDDGATQQVMLIQTLLGYFSSSFLISSIPCTTC